MPAGAARHRPERPGALISGNMNNRVVDIRTSFPLVDEILQSHSVSIGKDLTGYRNHVYRVLNYFAALSSPAANVPEAVLIASAFHDIGIWTDGTFDYLGPSARRSRAYLDAHGRANLGPEVGAVIAGHHKIRPYRLEFAGNVEAFRRADLVDVSTGVARFGLPRNFIRSVKATFPDAGFHWNLVKLAARQCLHTPLRPLPMIRW
jgi:hypothetical protein